MPKRGKTRAANPKKEAAPLRDPSAGQESPSDDVEDIPNNIPEENQEESVKLTDGQEDQLVGLIQDNANLYDKTNKQWLNKEARRLGPTLANCSSNISGASLRFWK
ncbi:hypothetical protein LOTGIDRAFT_158517 [Lottia gigantea]|uniref:Uncharacterized protein n=1 Tax=Lottia gigantea TaxID=225164 RepID=V4AQD4_LOTGI|nr:hypothetical protein LOTGIDRAFT_158517 [Lottia gigantea]ESO99432.1 hypothetical protein LOTGIDRAFT_158517 [Lottia gigantea]